MGIMKEAIKEYYRTKPKKEYKDKMLSPSMLGGCPRVMYYTLNGVPQTNPPDENAQMNFELGNKWESHIAEIFDNIGMLTYWWNEGQSKRYVANQEEWKGKLRQDAWEDSELNLRGTPDLVVTENGGYVLTDVKTASQDSAKFIVDCSNEEYFDDHIQHKLQLGSYLVLAKRRYQAGLEDKKMDYGKLIIISKDNGCILKEPVLMLTPELEREVLDRIDYLNFHIKTDSKPPCTCSGWQVNYCNYGDMTETIVNRKKRTVPTSCCKL